MTLPILLEHRDGVAFITLNRPERANVLDFEMGDALIATIDAVAGDAGVRAVLLQARGRQFCAGGDIGGFVHARDRLADMLDEHIPPLHRAIHKLATLPVPVVSALNGPIGGGGIGLALCADIVLAAESMKLRGGYSAIGLTPDVGGSWFLARRVGAARAKEIFFTNEPLSARECLQLGVVSQVHPDAELEAKAHALATSLARGATGSLGRIKDLVDGAGQRSLEAHLALEHRYMVESGGTGDAAEGVAAFIGKRAPVFGPEAP
ncbi:enoyl-CoA hydratase-related protein [Variovorax sp. dw_308]|uniref:enoyl-CoA hydratase-related protein n=1 Tax=Variovorax sp. dw_308 TaxID=2721546 RepID=UPI001C468A98|nr:enoyl-CoA hydratase-related protein [Variovorax sp. dw_308]